MFRRFSEARWRLDMCGARQDGCKPGRSLRRGGAGPFSSRHAALVEFNLDLSWSRALPERPLDQEGCKKSAR